MEEEINLIDYWRVIWKWKWFIAAITILGSVIALFFSLRIPNVYRSTAVIMPIGKSSSNIGTLTALAGVPGLGAAIGKEDGQIIAILSSRFLTEKVIHKFQNKLFPVLYTDLWNNASGQWKDKDPSKIPSMESTINTMLSHMEVETSTKQPTIDIHVQFGSKKLAQDIANAYVTELQIYLNENALTKSKQNRLFIEQSLEANKRQLLEAGKELSKFYETSISKLGSLIDADISVNKADSSTANEVNTKIVKNVPQQVYLQYLAQHRDLLSQVTGLLTQQYESAKIEESKDNLSFQVIDWANLPISKISPQRTHIIAFALLSSLISAIWLSFIIEYIKKSKSGTGKLH